MKSDVTKKTQRGTLAMKSYFLVAEHGSFELHAAYHEINIFIETGLFSTASTGHHVVNIRRNGSLVFTMDSDHTYFAVNLAVIGQFLKDQAKRRIRGQ